MNEKEKLKSRIADEDAQLAELKRQLKEKKYSSEIYREKLDELKLEEHLLEKLRQINKRLDKIEYQILKKRIDSPTYASFIQQLGKFIDEVASKKNPQSDILSKWNAYIDKLEQNINGNIHASKSEKNQILSALTYMKKLLENNQDSHAIDVLQKLSQEQQSSFDKILSILNRFPWYITMLLLPILLGYLTGLGVSYTAEKLFTQPPPRVSQTNSDNHTILQAIAQNNQIIKNYIDKFYGTPSMSTLQPIEESTIVLHYGKKETSSYEVSHLIERINKLPENQKYFCFIEGYASQEKIYSRTDFNSNYELATARALNTKYIILKHLRKNIYINFLINQKVDLSSTDEEARKVIVKLYRM